MVGRRVRASYPMHDRAIYRKGDSKAMTHPDALNVILNSQYHSDSNLLCQAVVLTLGPPAFQTCPIPTKCERILIPGQEYCKIGSIEDNE